MSKQVIILVNTGSPRTASESDVRSYLEEFLTDRDIISLPYLMRQILVRGIIVPRRVEYSSSRYRQLVTISRGSMPLTKEMQRIARLVELETDIPTLYAPRYAHTSQVVWGGRIAELAETEDVDILLLPLYPQYTRSSAGSAITYFSNLPKPSRGHYKTFTLSPWGTNPLYIQQLAQLIQDRVDTNDHRYHYIGTYHSIPKAHHKYDKAHGWDYHIQCLATLQAIMETLDIPTERYHLAFHSAMGRGEWSQPKLSDVLESLRAQGVDRVVLFSPSFIAECLETKIDLEIEAKAFFLSSGGKKLIYIPCLSRHPNSAKLIATLVSQI